MPEILVDKLKEAMHDLCNSIPQPDFRSTTAQLADGAGPPMAADRSLKLIFVFDACGPGFVHPDSRGSHHIQPRPLSECFAHLLGLPVAGLLLSRTPQILNDLGGQIPLPMNFPFEPHSSNESPHNTGSEDILSTVSDLNFMCQFGRPS